MKVNSDNTYVISFSGFLTTLITLASMIFTSGGSLPDWTKWALTLFYIALYFFLALSTGEFHDIPEFTSRLLLIFDDKGMSSEEKLMVIRDQLSLFSELFSKIFVEVKEFYSGGQKFHKTWEEIKTIFARAVHGTINMYQALWIFAYSGYQVLIRYNFFNIPEPLIYIVTLGFILGLALTSGNIQGIGKLLRNIYEKAQQQQSEKQTKLNLNIIIHSIKTLTLMYNRIAKQLKSKLGSKSIMEHMLNTWKYEPPKEPPKEKNITKKKGE